jgi:DNA-binding FadR family transcriptional regulator
MEAEVDNIDGYRALADAVSEGDRAAAKNAADELLRPATEALSRLLAMLDS